MSALSSLEAIAIKAKGMAGLLDCFTATVGPILALSSDTRPIPRGIADGPVGMVTYGSASMVGGNAESLNVTAWLDIWCPSADVGYALNVLAPFYDRVPDKFRLDLDLGGEATRCICMGWDAMRDESINGEQPYLVIPFRLEVLLMTFGSTASI